LLNPRLARFLAAAFFVLGFSQHVRAQSCPAEAHTVHGNISVGDGSTSPALARASMWNCSAQGGITSGWGDVGVVIYEPTPAEGCSFLGGVDGYYWGTVDGNATCSYQFDPSVQLICLQCSPLNGAFNLPLYAQQGTFSGTVTVLPDKLAGTNGGTVSVDAVGCCSAAVDPATDSENRLERHSHLRMGRRESPFQSAWGWFRDRPILLRSSRPPNPEGRRGNDQQLPL